ncbi:MAG TPA: HepT-like ribonuclease domain-containing protein [Burkholderiales bacterium]|nr:HepT-like ribonuclease domain-containing protein [Burkholderiales bacterium]
MRSDPTADALKDIKANIALAQSFIGNLSFAEFQSDRRTVYAVTRCLEIISEASRRLPAELKQRYPDIPWSDIAAAGSVYRHAYQLIRDDFLWRTIQNSLEQLRIAVEHELRQRGEN